MSTATQNSGAETPPEVQEPSRIGPLGTFMIALGGSIGGGIIFLVLGTALGVAGSGLLVAWLIGGILSLGVAFNYSELATSLPIVGGGYTFLKEGIGGVLAFLIGFFMLIGNVGFCAFNAFGFVITLRVFIPTLDPSLATFIAILIVVGFYFLATRFGAGSPKFQSRIGLLLLGIFLFFIIMGLTLGPIMNPVDFDMSRLVGEIEFVPVLQMVAFLFASFVSFEFLYGFETLITLYENVEKPEKNIPRANITAVVASLVLYLFVTIVVLVNLPAYGGAENILSVTLGQVLGSFGSYFMAIGAAIACLTSLFASMVNSSRIVYALSRDNYLPNFFKKINKRTQLPHRALLLTIIVVIGFLLFAELDLTLELADFGFLVGLAFINITVIILRQRRKKLDRPFKTILYPVLPIVSAIFCVILAAQLSPITIVLSVAVAFIGLLFYAVKIARRVDLMLVLGGLKIFSILGCVAFLLLTEIRFEPLTGNVGALEILALVILYLAIALTAFTLVFDLLPVSRIYRWRKDKSEEVVAQAGDMKIFSFTDDEIKAINRMNHILGGLQLVVAGILSLFLVLVWNEQIIFESYYIIGLESAPRTFIQYSIIILITIFAGTMWVSGFTGIYLEWERHAVKAY